jgi:hypothetical protein
LKCRLQKSRTLIFGNTTVGKGLIDCMANSLACHQCGKQLKVFLVEALIVHRILMTVHSEEYLLLLHGGNAMHRFFLASNIGIVAACIAAAALTPQLDDQIIYRIVQLENAQVRLQMKLRAVMNLGEMSGSSAESKASICAHSIRTMSRARSFRGSIYS